MDLVYDSIDCFHRAITSSFEKDAEIEGISFCYLGKIYYKCLKDSQKGIKHYRSCVRILETLKPRVFNDLVWHKLMMKHMQEIEDANQKKEAEAMAKENQAMIEQCQAELEALQKITQASEFLKHLSENYVSYKNEKVVFSEEDLKTGKLKKTLLKTTIHYHPDKQKTLENWSEIFDEK